MLFWFFPFQEWSQFLQHFMSRFYTIRSIPKTLKDGQVVNVFFALLRSLHVKTVHQMLVTLTRMCKINRMKWNRKIMNFLIIFYFFSIKCFSMPKDIEALTHQLGPYSSSSHLISLQWSISSTFYKKFFLYKSFFPA